MAVPTASLSAFSSINVSSGAAARKPESHAVTAASSAAPGSSSPVPKAAAGQTYPLANRITAYSYFDFNTNVTLVKGIDVRFNVQNLFDKDPPLIGFDTTYGIGQYFNTFPAYYQVRGRTVRVGLSARF